MSLMHVASALAPEFVLLLGAGVVLMLGLSRGSSRAVAPTALLVLILALAAALFGSAQTQGEVVPGLWLSSLAVYTRWITLAVGSLIVLVNWHQPEASERGEYMGLILFSLLGLNLTGMANDLVVLFFAIELVSVPTYVLIALSRSDARASEASVKYFFLGALSAAILALGLANLYGAAGTTTLHSFAGGSIESNFRSAGLASTPVVIGFLLLFAGLAFKIAAVPFHVYAADVYEGAAAPVTGLLGFVPKLAGFVALVKLLAAFEWNLPPSVAWTIWIVAAATMTTGNVLALLQKNAKRMLAYSSIAHTGYMLVAVLAGPAAGSGPLRDGTAALLFYIVVYGTMNLGAFAMLAAFRAGAREIEMVEELAGMARRSPAAALGFAVCVFSLMGIPPTAGLLGKVYIFSSALSLPAAHPMHDAMIVLVVIGVINTAIGAAYYLRLVTAAYVSAESVEVSPASGLPVRFGLALCSIPLILLFLRPELLTRQAGQATVAIQTALAHDSRTAGASGPGVMMSPPQAALESPGRQSRESHGRNSHP